MESMLLAAFGKVKITPEEHAPLQGYDPCVHIADPAADVLDDLYAKIVVLDDGSIRKLIVVIDCCLTNEVPFLATDPSGRGGSYRLLANTFSEGTRHEWGEAAGVDEASVSVHATHTHSAPAYFSNKYTSRITAMIKETVGKLRPVRVKAATGNWSVSVNRRPHLRHNDSLPVDRTFHMIVFETMQGEPVGALVNGAVHPTLLMNPFKRVSAEFVGLAMNELEERFGNDFISLFIQGFAGDVGPAGHDRKETFDTYPLVKEMAHRMYNDIAECISGLTPIAFWPLLSLEKSIKLPTRKGYYTPYLDITIHGLRIGDAALISASGEIFNGYTGLVRQQSPFPYTLLAGCANGYCGYLPASESFQDGLGGYEMNTTPYSEDACAIFADEAAQLVRSLQKS